MAKRTAIFVCAVAAGLCGCDRGATPAEPTAPTTRAPEGCATEPAAKVRAVFHYLHRLNESEVRSGNLAADRTRLDEVRKFAVQMVDEHAAADQKLVDLARRESIDIASFSPMDPIHAAALRFIGDEDLANISPPAFDAAYVTSQVELHAIAVKVIDEGQRVAAGDVKSLLDDARDMSAEHLDHATLLLQDFRFSPRGVGGGPVRESDTSSDLTSGQPSAPHRKRSVSESPATSHPSDESRANDDSRPSADPLALDGGVWPPVTAPPERINHLP